MSKKRIEDVISDVLKGDAQKNALDLVAFLRANDIPLKESENYWEVKYKDECVCFMWIDGSDNIPGPWTIWSAQVPGTWPECRSVGEYEDISEIVWANINICGNCGACDKSGGNRKTVLGKDFDNLCNSAMAFRNPDAEALECVKKMVDVRKSDILKKI